MTKEQHGITEDDLLTRLNEEFNDVKFFISHVNNSDQIVVHFKLYVEEE